MQISFWLRGVGLGLDLEKVTEALRAKCHEVFPVILTGLGERVHSANSKIYFQTRGADVVNLIKYYQLKNVYLTGYSYNGMLITQIADHNKAARN